MRHPTDDHQAFEAFYKDVRDRLLLQTWALTGDLSAGQKAVRDALVVAWHHWRKVRRLRDDAAREDWVRPLAWQRAQRRHSVPHFHRDRDIDPGVRATLTALGKLPITQRKVLLLSCLAPVSLEQLSREVGIPQVRTERELQAATAQFSLLRDVPTTSILPLFEPMAAHVAEQRWPRPTILTRAGSARRRTHTLAGALVAVACLVGAGAFVTDGATSHPTLAALSLHGSDLPAGESGPSGYPLTPTSLLTDAEVDQAVPGRWTTRLTSDSGTTSLPCAERAAADKHPRVALVRTFSGKGKHDLVGQAVEAAGDTDGAESAYTTTLGWYAGCDLPRMQLIDTRTVSGVGDEATLFALRDWTSAEHALVVGVARTGVLTTTVAASVPGTALDAVRRGPALLAGAVRHLCGLPGAGACVTTPKASTTDPLPVGAKPAMLDVVDLPPVTGVTQPWVGTAPQPARSNQAASHCDNTDFHVKGVSDDLTRTFLIPEDKSLPPVFGLSETVGSLADSDAAAGFVRDIEHKLAACGDKELGSDATRLSAPATNGPVAVSLWHVEIGRDQGTTTYLMALVRRGSAVAQLSFIPAGKATMDPAAFRDLTLRAAARLAQLKS